MEDEKLSKSDIYELILIPIAYYLICTFSFFVYGKFMLDQFNIITVLWLIITAGIPTGLYAFYNAGLFTYNLLCRKQNRIFYVSISLLYSLIPMSLIFLTVPYLLDVF